MDAKFGCVNYICGGRGCEEVDWVQGEMIDEASLTCDGSDIDDGFRGSFFYVDASK